MAFMNGLMPGEWEAQQPPNGGWTGKPTNNWNDKMQGLLGNPLLQIGLGILANNNGQQGVGATLAGGAMQGMQNINQYQQQAQQNKFRDAQMKRYEMETRGEEAKQRQAEEGLKAQKRLLNPNSYKSQPTQVSRDIYAPQAATEGAQAPNFGMTKQSITETVEGNGFDEGARRNDLVTAGYGGELIKAQIKPRKVTYIDDGSSKIPIDEDTGLVREDLKPIALNLSPQAQLNAMMENHKFNNLSASQKASNDITIRGQNLTNERAREKNGIDGGFGKAPSGYRYKQDGNLEPIPGGPGEKGSSATEGERKAATLLKRIEFSQSQLTTALKGNESAAKPTLGVEMLRALGGDATANMATDGPRQQVEAAQLDILDAALTLGTGAAYTKEQLQGYRKSYFPQIGDGADVIKDKELRLGNVIEAAKVAAGRAITPTELPPKPIMASDERMPPVKIKGNPDYNALPIGTLFIDPFGKQRRKP